MTAIASIITSHFTAHATDSFLTRPDKDGGLEIVESQESKLIRVEAWRGALAYWGLADYSGWNTRTWLAQRASAAGNYCSAEAFVIDLAQKLTQEWATRGFQGLRYGLGIHFTAYEWINDYWIPELFLVSNWKDVAYAAINPEFQTTRETYASLNDLQDRPETQRDPACRLSVHQALRDHKVLLQFNNGDPELFNRVSQAVLGTFGNVLARGQIADPQSSKTHLALVRRPIEIVSKLLADFARGGTRKIGGKLHDLAISPSGEYFSTTGD